MSGHFCSVAAALVLSASTCGPMWAQAVCRQSDSTSSSLIATLTRYAAATNGDDKVVRDSLRLPAAPPSQVALVTQESVCRKANQTYQGRLAGTGGSAFSGSVYVVQVGSAFAALDPGFHYNGDPRFWTVVVMDSRYRALSIF